MKTQVGNSIALSKQLILYRRQLQAWLLFSPEWWVWVISAFVWIWLIGNLEPGAAGEHVMHQMLDSTTSMGGSSEAVMAINKGFVPWVLMIMAMMFPMLNDPIRHVAFSIRRKHRNLAISAFQIFN